jgi:hypothetical protein
MNLFIVAGAGIIAFLWYRNQKSSVGTSVSVPITSPTVESSISDVPTYFSSSLSLSGLSLSWYTPSELTYKLAQGYQFVDMPEVENPCYDATDPNSTPMIPMLTAGALQSYISQYGRCPVTELQQL